MNTYKKITCQTIGFLLFLGLVSCAPGPSSQSAPQPPGMALPTPTLPALPPTAAATEAPTPEASLSGGLWLILQTGQGVEAFDPVRDERRTLLANADPDQPVLAIPSPAGGWFALVNGQDASLSFFRLPETGERLKISLLSNPGISADKLGAYRQTAAASDPPALAWSPDGETAAFLAAIDNPYLELYLFDTADLSVTRLSEEIQDIYAPVWSPDGAWIVFDVTDGLNEVGLWTVAAVKSVRPNAGETRLLYEPQSYAEPVVGWTGPESFIVHSVRDRGPVDLREVNLGGGEARPIFAGVFNHPVYHPERKAAAFLISDSFIDPKLQPAGIYTGSSTRPAKLLAPGLWDNLAWNQAAGLFFAVENQKATSAVTADGKLAAFASENSLPQVSPSGGLIAFAGGRDSTLPGLRLYSPDGKLASDVTAQPVESFLWLPDGSLVFGDGFGLYRVASPDQKAVRIADAAGLVGFLDARTNP